MARIGTTAKKAKATRKAKGLALADTLPDAMMVIADGKVAYANRAMSRLLGLPTGRKLSGRRLVDLLVAPTDDTLAAIESVADGESGHDRIQIIWRRNRRVPMVTECALGGVIWQAGPATQIVARDITKRVASDDVIRRAGTRMAAQLDVGRKKLTASNKRVGSETLLRERAEFDRNAALVRLALAGEEERKRLSRELHDEVGQHLTALLLGLQRIIDVAGVGSEVDGQAKELLRLAQRLGGDLHSVAVRLRPKALDDFGIEAALASYTKEWTRQSGILAELQTTGHPARLSENVETTLYRIAQEALTNVSRHSGAARVSVVLHKGDDMCRLAIEDDGRGFDPEVAWPIGAEPPGLGLVGMRERARLLGGTIDIESTPGGGTSVFVSVPSILADVTPGRRVRR